MSIHPDRISFQLITISDFIQKTAELNHNFLRNGRTSAEKQKTGGQRKYAARFTGIQFKRRKVFIFTQKTVYSTAILHFLSTNDGIDLFGNLANIRIFNRIIFHLDDQCSGCIQRHFILDDLYFHSPFFRVGIDLNRCSIHEAEILPLFGSSSKLEWNIRFHSTDR